LVVVVVVVVTIVVVVVVVVIAAAVVVVVVVVVLRLVLAAALLIVAVRQSVDGQAPGNTNVNQRKRCPERPIVCQGTIMGWSVAIGIRRYLGKIDSR
jgi:hypothetical protein